MNETQDSPTDPRIYMAAERTFLAWIRTGIAFMGFGFMVARFGLFLREIALGNNVTVPPAQQRLFIARRHCPDRRRHHGHCHRRHPASSLHQGA